MPKLNRRAVLHMGGLGGVVAAAGLPPAWAAAQNTSPRRDAEDPMVRLTGDGLGLTPAQYARVLAQLADRGIAEDDYILGGVVDELEARMAKLLGKERAVFMPTGTLANNLAIRALAGGTGRAVVQADSHIYLDSGDCVQTLSHVTLMPLGGRAGHVHSRGAGAPAAEERDGTRGDAHRRRVDRVPGAPDAGADLRSGRAREGHRRRPQGQRAPAPRWRAPVSRSGVRAQDRGGVRRAVRHRLRVAVQVLQRVVRRDSGRSSRPAGRHVPRASHVRRRARAAHGPLLPWRCTTWTASTNGTARRSVCRRTWRGDSVRTSGSP